MSIVVSSHRSTVTLVLCASLVGTSIASAHELSVTTATVTLRQGHANLTLHVDLFAWLERIRGGEQEVEVEKLSLVDPGALEALVLEAKRRFVEETMLSVDERKVTLDAVQFPSMELIHSAAKKQVMARAVEPKGRSEHVAISADARLIGSPRAVSVSLPSSLGNWMVSFVEPTSAMLREGQAAGHTLRPVINASSSGTHIGFLGLCGIIAFIAGVWLGGMRTRSVSKQ